MDSSDPPPTREALLAWSEATLRAAPTDPAPLLKAARALRSRGDLGAALDCLEHAVRIAPDSAALHHDRGLLLHEGGHLAAAAAALVRALELAPRSATTHAALASVRRAQGEATAAIEGFRTALALAPRHGATHNNLGLALRDTGDLEGAIRSYRAAIAAEPTLARPYYNLGVALRERRLLPEALEAQRQALARRAPYPLAEAELLRCSLELGDWTALDSARAGVRTALAAGQFVSPFTVLGAFDDPALQLQAAQRYARSVGGAATPSPPVAVSADGRLRIAYLSSDFHRHATSYLLVELLELHDRMRFEILGVSFGRDDGSDLRRRVLRSFDDCLDARNLTDADICSWLRSRRVDIVVDLKGYTQGARPGILARRPAAVQVSYLGYPGTSGAPHVDYLVADEVLIPPSMREYYSEAIIYLPGCYQPNDRQRAIDGRPVARREHGLPDRGFVFCCFNNAWKVNPEMFAIWMRLLARVPDSVLWLLAWNRWQPDNLRAAAARHGIDPARLVFGERVPTELHLARHRLADLFLDTVPCNAHTTASDALWAGLPVLTISGRSFAARVAGSLLHAVGLGDLACESLEAYERRALAIAADPAAADGLRQRLAAARSTSALFDTDRYRVHLEAAWSAIATRAARGEAPADLFIAREQQGADCARGQP